MPVTGNEFCRRRHINLKKNKLNLTSYPCSYWAPSDFKSFQECRKETQHLLLPTQTVYYADQALELLRVSCFISDLMLCLSWQFQTPLTKGAFKTFLPLASPAETSEPPSAAHAWSVHAPITSVLRTAPCCGLFKYMNCCLYTYFLTVVPIHLYVSHCFHHCSSW